MVMADENPEPTEPPPSSENEDDRRAAAAAANRKRALEDWESKKKRWRATGIPPALPAAGSAKPKK
jgi:hypothetical protein